MRVFKFYYIYNIELSQSSTLKSLFEIKVFQVLTKYTNLDFSEVKQKHLTQSTFHYYFHYSPEKK